MTESETPIEPELPAAADPQPAETPAPEVPVADEPETASEPVREPAPDVGQAELQAAYDEAQAKGFFGEPVDDKPNEHYTFPGPPSSEPAETPEGSDAS